MWNIQSIQRRNASLRQSRTPFQEVPLRLINPCWHLSSWTADATRRNVPRKLGHIMSQQRITLFFPLVWTKKTSPDAKCLFLELPVGIRRKIYHEAGLVSGKTIHINFWATRDDDSNLPSLPLGLFAVCRLVNDKLMRIFYGKNLFAITRRAPGGLRALERFSDSTLEKFRFLVIRVNLASCTNACCGDWDRRCGNGHVSCGNPSSHDAIMSQALISGQVIISQ